MAVTNSFDAERPVTYIVRPELKNEITPSGSFVTTLKASYRWRVEEYQYEQFSDADLSSYFRSGEPERARSQRSPSMTRYKSYSIETRDLVSEEVVSSEELLNMKKHCMHILIVMSAYIHTVFHPKTNCFSKEVAESKQAKIIQKNIFGMSNRTINGLKFLLILASKRTLPS